MNAYWFLLGVGVWCVFTGAWALSAGDMAGAVVVLAGAALAEMVRERAHEAR